MRKCTLTRQTTPLTSSHQALLYLDLVYEEKQGFTGQKIS